MQEYDINFYKQLEDDYDYIVPRFEHIFDDNFIKLDQSKYEIMLNDTCVYNCKYWKEHFEADAKINRICAGKNPWETLGYNKCHKIEECWLKDFDPNIGDLETIKKYASNYGMDLKKDQINRLINQGINRFKIMGRENTKEELFESVNNYLLFNKIK
jgi:hypothetical protein